jgi:hypothetical protein
MTAQELKDKLTEDDIKQLLIYMDADITYEDDDLWISTTVCHHGNKSKLYYYKDSKSFHCYTECGQMDIIGLVKNYNGYSDDEFYKAINWICVKLNISDESQFGFFGDKPEPLSDWQFINNYKRSSKHIGNYDNKELIPYDKKVLNLFQEMYYQEWINEGISVDTMKKYGILYSTAQQKIIIPHYDYKNNLIGIRCRSLVEEDVEIFGKYSPLRIGKKIYNHSLGQNLFGLNHNLEAIQRKQKIMLVEAEKSVMQTDTMFGDDNFTVALCGSNLTDYQRRMILNLKVKEVIVALDKQFESIDSQECKDWAAKIQKQIISQLSQYVKISILWDCNNLLPYKASPTDKGKEILLNLMDNKIIVGTKG